MTDTKHKIINSDSRMMNELESESIHLIITSPPYCQFKDYGTDNQIGFYIIKNGLALVENSYEYKYKQKFNELTYVKGNKKYSMDFGRKEKVLNYAYQTYQLSRPNNVGEVMVLIRECQPKTIQELEQWYFEKAFSYCTSTN